MSARLPNAILPIAVGVWAGLIGFGSFARILTPYGFSLSLLDITSLLLLALLGLPKLRGFRNPWQGFFVYLGFGFLISAFFYSTRTNIVGLLYLLRLLVYAALVVQLGSIEKSLLKRCFFITLTTIALTSVLQYFLLPNLSFLEYLGWDDHSGRLFGSFFDAHIAGVMYGLSAIGLYLLSKEGQRSKVSKEREKSEHSKVSKESERSGGGLERVGYGVGAAVAALALYLSLSRLALLSVGVATVVAGKGHVRKAFLIGLFTAALLLLVRYSPTRIGSEATHLLRTSTLSSRFVDIRKGITLGMGHPLIGVGYNRLPFYKTTTESSKPFEVLEQHARGAYPSVLVTIFTTGGIIGLILFLRLCWWLWKISNDDQRFILLFVYIASLLESTLLIPVIISYSALLWWMLKEVKSSKSA
jgi:O-Antigen ligase